MNVAAGAAMVGFRPSVDLDGASFDAAHQPGHEVSKSLRSVFSFAVLSQSFNQELNAGTAREPSYM